MPLTVLAVSQAPPREKMYRLADGGGLVLEVRPTGLKVWRWRYRHAGRAQMATLGRCPPVGLVQARKLRDRAKVALDEGVDPASVRKRARIEAILSEAATSGTTFEDVGRAFLEREAGRLAETTRRKNVWLLESFAFPFIGAMQIDEITPRMILSMLRRVEGRGKYVTANRLKQKTGQVFRYAIIEGLTETDPTAPLKGALETARTVHHGAITEPRAIGALLRAIDAYDGQALTRAALRFLPLVFVRPGELRFAVWAEFDLAAAEWRIPAERTKMRTPHLVPLSRQALALLRELQVLTGPTGYVFPSLRTATRPMSENTLTAALRRLGYAAGEATAHGFRATAASRLNELGWRGDVIERQLAHIERSEVRAAYTHGAEFLDDRRRMMQAWADYLDALRDGKAVGQLGRPD